MFAPDQYELVDFGAGRKLERFAGRLLDRPAPAADGQRLRPELWFGADARFERGVSGEGSWRSRPSLPPSWLLAHAPFTLDVKLTVAGQTGVFPEQARNWDWLSQQVRASPNPCRVLNLFAYTGGSTLAAAAAGAEVSHVDAAKTSVAWARRNARLSGLDRAPIRWIVEDARTFVRRETSRGRTYRGIILDPPSYGHGPQGLAWKLERDLPELLEACWPLLAEEGRFLLVTGHTPGLGWQQVLKWLPRAVADAAMAEELHLETADGRRMGAGMAVRWSTDGRSAAG